MTFEVHHHARMLRDAVRLDAYDRALGVVVRAGDHVVDAGSGTGVLAALATKYTAGKVTGIEYLTQTAEFAQQAADAAGLSNLTILPGNAISPDLSMAPDVVVTETIGALGPEENIVGICHSLKKRYPEIRALIPSTLRLLAAPGIIPEATAMRDAVLNAFRDAGRRTGLRFDTGLGEVESELGRMILNGRLAAPTPGDSTEPTVLAEYRLGETSDPTFSVTLDAGQFDAVHIWFEAQLADQVWLSTSRSSALTHWGHSYVVRPRTMRLVTLSFRSGAPGVEAVWAEPQS